jgi:hypothetical protein
VNQAETDEYLELLSQDIIGDLMDLKVIDSGTPIKKLDLAALYIKRRLDGIKAELSRKEGDR